MQHAGGTCRASPNFGDRCQRHRGAHFRELADKSYRHGVMRIQYTALPAISRTLSPAGQKKKEQWEECYGSSTIKARRDDATMSDATCGVSLPRWIQLHNRQTSSPDFSAERDETDEAVHDPPQGIRRRRTSVMSMFSCDFAGAQSPVLSWKFTAFVRRVVEERLDLSANGYLSLQTSNEPTLPFYLPIVNFLQYTMLR